MSSALLSVEVLEYRDVGCYAKALAAGVAGPEAEVIQPVQDAGVPEDEVTRRVQSAREEARAEAEARIRVAQQREREKADERLGQRLQEFEIERSNYLRSMEREVVQLALAIARKIVQREAQLDPALLAGLVRIALDRMQPGPAVQVRVAPGEAERWTRLGRNETGEARWNVIADEQLEPGDCMVETQLGTANFSFEAQLHDVEESIAQLLAHRPAA